jgi:hypothetical protein
VEHEILIGREAFFLTVNWGQSPQGLSRNKASFHSKLYCEIRSIFNVRIRHSGLNQQLGNPPVGMVTQADRYGWSMSILAKDIEDFLEEIE